MEPKMYNVLCHNTHIYIWATNRHNLLININATISCGIQIKM